jgi:hypothetical protein
MPIKKKDGSYFRLSQPNPVMLKQDLWGQEKLILHNFRFNEVVSYQYTNMDDNEPEPTYVDLEDISLEEISVPIRETPIIELPKKKEKKQSSIKKEDISFFYCMPAVITETFDPLYGETKSSISYGSQFTFEGVMVLSSDLACQVWTNLTKIERGSILYVPSERRWWSVDRVTYRDGGLLMDCSPSGLQPAFT